MVPSTALRLNFALILLTVACVFSAKAAGSALECKNLFVASASQIQLENTNPRRGYSDRTVAEGFELIKKANQTFLGGLLPASVSLFPATPQESSANRNQKTKRTQILAATIVDDQGVAHFDPAILLHEYSHGLYAENKIRFLGGLPEFEALELKYEREKLLIPFRFMDSAYQEIFADTLPIIYLNDHSAIAKSLGPMANSFSSPLFIQLRDFSKNHPESDLYLAMDIKKDPHVFFALARSFVGRIVREYPEIRPQLLTLLFSAIMKEQAYWESHGYGLADGPIDGDVYIKMLNGSLIDRIQSEFELEKNSSLFKKIKFKTQAFLKALRPEAEPQTPY